MRNKKKIIITTEEDLLNIKNNLNRDYEESFYIIANDMKKFKSFYYLYEFSDNISYVSRNIVNYPTFFNYVDAGVLTIDELMDVILY